MSFYIGKAGKEIAGTEALPLNFRNLRASGESGFEFDLYVRKLDRGTVLSPRILREMYTEAIFAMMCHDKSNLEGFTRAAFKNGDFDDRILLHTFYEEDLKEHILKEDVYGFEVFIDASYFHFKACI